jgi:hypothetical protein
MTGTPTTYYALGPRGALAYQVTGTGPVDVLMVPGMHSTSNCSGSYRDIAGSCAG